MAVPILVENEHLQIWQLLTALLALLELKHSHLHIVSILNIKAEKTPQHFNASLFVTIWDAVICSFLTIDARMGRVMKRGVLQTTRPCLQAHYSSLGPARGLLFSLYMGLTYGTLIKFSKISPTRAGSYCQRTSYGKWPVL